MVYRHDYESAKEVASATGYIFFAKSAELTFYFLRYDALYFFHSSMIFGAFLCALLQHHDIC